MLQKRFIPLLGCIYSYGQIKTKISAVIHVDNATIFRCNNVLSSSCLSLYHIRRLTGPVGCILSHITVCLCRVNG